MKCTTTRVRKQVWYDRFERNAAHRILQGAEFG